MREVSCSIKNGEYAPYDTTAGFTLSPSAPVKGTPPSGWTPGPETAGNFLAVFSGALHKPKVPASLIRKRPRSRDETFSKQ